MLQPTFLAHFLPDKTFLFSRVSTIQFSIHKCFLTGFASLYGMNSIAFIAKINLFFFDESYQIIGPLCFNQSNFRIRWSKYYRLKPNLFMNEIL